MNPLVGCDPSQHAQSDDWMFLSDTDTVPTIVQNQEKSSEHVFAQVMSRELARKENEMQQLTKDSNNTRIQSLVICTKRKRTVSNVESIISEMTEEDSNDSFVSRLSSNACDTLCSIHEHRSQHGQVEESLNFDDDTTRSSSTKTAVTIIVDDSNHIAFFVKNENIAPIFIAEKCVEL